LFTYRQVYNKEKGVLREKSPFESYRSHKRPAGVRKPYLEKKGKTAEKLSLLATSPLSLASESLPRPPSKVFTAAIPLHKVRLFN
jgi:hypothetical protein